MSENRSDNGTATADSEYSGSYPATNFNDLDTGTRWISAATLPHWGQVEWETENHITEVGFYAGTVGNGEHFTEYYIEHWDGSNWVEDVHVSSYTDQYPTRTSHVVDFTTKKARLRTTDGHSYSTLYELEFIGEEIITTFTFTDPSPTHLSTVYGNNQTCLLYTSPSPRD